jgi:hypothetical protein
MKAFWYGTKARWLYHWPLRVKWGKCILYFYMDQSYSGERCGPWASCISFCVKHLSISFCRNISTINIKTDDLHLNPLLCYAAPSQKSSVIVTRFNGCSRLTYLEQDSLRRNNNCKFSPDLELKANREKKILVQCEPVRLDWKAEKL